jgi:hypothetical protein
VILKTGQTVISADGHLLGHLSEIERDSEDMAIGIVFKREDLPGRTTRVPAAWIAAIAGDDLHLAVSQAEISLLGSTIRLDPARLRQLQREFELQRELDRPKSGPCIHPNWFRTDESCSP